MSARNAGTARELPPGLWNRLRLDPLRSPEHIALAAAATFGPQAAAWATEKRSRYAVAPDELARMAKSRHATLARLEGAATGVGGFVTVVPDMVALVWIQARLVFYVAAAYGFDPETGCGRPRRSCSSTCTPTRWRRSASTSSRSTREPM